MATLADIVRERFGGTTMVRRNDAGSSVTTAVKTVARQNPQRVQLLITNLGSSRIFVDSDRGVSATKGVPVDAGGSLLVSVEEDGEEVGAEWFAIASTGTQILLVKETVVTREGVRG